MPLQSLLLFLSIFLAAGPAVGQLDRVEQAIRDLAVAEKREAARTFLRAGDASVGPRLIAALATAPQAAVPTLLAVIGQRRDPGARDALVQRLGSHPRAAVIALGHLGQDDVLPEVFRTMITSRDRLAQVEAAIAACRLGGRAGIDVLFSTALAIGGPEVKRAFEGLKLCLDEKLVVPETITEVRTGPYHLRRRWLEAGGAMPLRVGPKAPSDALKARVAELVAAIGTHEKRADRDRHRVLMTAFRATAAERICETFASRPRGPARREAVRILVELGEAAGDAVEDLLDHPDVSAVDLGIETASRMLVRRRAFPKLETRLRSLEPVVLEKLAALEPVAMTEALRFLGLLGTPASVPACLALVRDAERPEAVRAEAARTLGLLGAQDARGPLFHLVHEAATPATLRAACGMSAALLGEPRAIGHLVGRLAEEPAALTVLRRLDGTPYFGYEFDQAGAVKRWAEYWKSFAPVIRYSRPRILDDAMWALEREVFRDDIVGGWLAGLSRDRQWTERVGYEDAMFQMVPKITPILVEQLRSSKDATLRFHAAQLIGICGERAGVPGLVTALSDPSPLVRATAAEGLGVIGQCFEYEPYAEGLRPGLARMLGDPDAWCRIAAAAALARLRYPDGIPMVISALESLDPAIVDHAWITLRTITAGKDFGFHPGLALADRQNAITAARAWWNKEGRTFRPRIRRPREGK